MRAVSIPTLAGASVAGCSLIYFTGISLWIGDDALSKFVVAMAEVAVLQAIVLPRSWLYILSASPEQHRQRVGASILIELSGGGLGLLLITVIGAARSLSYDDFLLRLVLYASLWVASLTSATAVYRVQQRWTLYYLWVAGSSVLRFPLLALLVQLERGDTSILHAATATYLVPEAIRFVGGYVPLVRSFRNNFQDISLREALRGISANWRFDVGSALTDSLDKIVVNAFFSPQVLVTYFFARRIAGVIPMIIEPVYAHVYHSHIRALRPITLAFHSRTYVRGLLIALSTALIISVGAFAMSRIEPLNTLMPPAIASGLASFILVLCLDAVFFANKWYRFASQNYGANLLLVIRIASFFVFYVVAKSEFYLFQPNTPSTALAITLGLDAVALGVIILSTTREKCRPKGEAKP